MKIAVYAIAKNEERHVARFMSSLQGADAVFILDTGSTDNTVSLLREAGAVVKTQVITPWRFDVARNLSLEMVPDFDVCVTLDLDEVLSPGWRQVIERHWTPHTTNLRYPYIWSHNVDGSPAVTFRINKIHRRRGFRWVHPVHEVLSYDGQDNSVECDLEVHHYPDATKPRSYLPLLELAVKENPESDRNSHYLAREYMGLGRLPEAIAEFKRHLSLKSSIWDVERAASMRYLARCHQTQGQLFEARQWALRACAEAPMEREPWWELAKVAYALKDWHGLYFASVTALSRMGQGERYIADPAAWGYGPWDFAAIGAHFIGHKADAIRHGEEALAVALRHGEKDVDRLKSNLAIYRT